MEVFDHSEALGEFPFIFCVVLMLQGYNYRELDFCSYTDKRLFVFRKIFLVIGKVDLREKESVKLAKDFPYFVFV